MKTIAQLVQDHIITALGYFNGNRQKAADALGITRRGLTGKLKRYKEKGINVPEPEKTRKTNEV